MATTSRSHQNKPFQMLQHAVTNLDAVQRLLVALLDKYKIVKSQAQTASNVSTQKAFKDIEVTEKAKYNAERNREFLHDFMQIPVKDPSHHDSGKVAKGQEEEMTAAITVKDVLRALDIRALKQLENQDLDPALARKDGIAPVALQFCNIAHLLRKLMSEHTLVHTVHLPLYADIFGYLNSLPDAVLTHRLKGLMTSQAYLDFLVDWISAQVDFLYRLSRVGDGGYTCHHKYKLGEILLRAEGLDSIDGIKPKFSIWDKLFKETYARMLTAKDNTGHGPAAIRGVVEKMKVANLCRFHDYLPQNEEEGLLLGDLNRSTTTLEGVLCNAHDYMFHRVSNEKQKEEENDMARSLGQYYTPGQDPTPGQDHIPSTQHIGYVYYGIGSESQLKKGKIDPPLPFQVSLSFIEKLCKSDKILPGICPSLRRFINYYNLQSIQPHESARICWEPKGDVGMEFQRTEAEFRTAIAVKKLQTK